MAKGARAQRRAVNRQLAKDRLSQNGNVTVQLTTKEQKILVELVSQNFTKFPITSFRNRYLKIDLAYAMEKSAEALAKDSVELKRYIALELPVIKPNIDSSSAYLASIFLSGHPIMGVTADKEHLDSALQMEAVIEENSTASGWTRQLNMYLTDGQKYNFQGVEVNWRTQQIYKPITDLSSANKSGAVSSRVLREGNELKRMDPYNTYYDTNVQPADVHTDGDYVGYVERLTRTKLYSRITEMVNNGEHVMNQTEEMWQSMPLHIRYYEPQILRDDDVPLEGMDWFAFLGVNENQAHGDAGKSDYELSTMYVRLLPYVHGLKIPNAEMVQIWKLVVVNGQHLISAQRQNNAHDYLPILIGQPHEDGLRFQTKGMGQNLLPFQELCATMHRARMASLERSISDRGIYDPIRIAEKVINSKVPSAKMPVRPGAYGKGLEDVYRPIPFDNRQDHSLLEEIRQIHQWSQEVSHINQSQRGQFVKGNKTLEEYSDVMANADSTHQAAALVIESQTWVPMKEIVKTNILQFQGPGEGLNPEDQSVITIDPATLREASLQFKIADGLLPKDKLLSTPTLELAFNTMATVPSIGLDYNVGEMFVYLMEIKGAKLQQFKRDTPLTQLPGTPPVPSQ